MHAHPTFSSLPLLSDGHMINTKCSSSHNRRALCCKMSVEFDRFLDSGRKWVLFSISKNSANVSSNININIKSNININTLTELWKNILIQIKHTANNLIDNINFLLVLPGLVIYVINIIESISVLNFSVWKIIILLKFLLLVH